MTMTVQVMHYDDIRRCPHVILLPSHYRPDGSCKCDDPAERRMMIRRWGYRRSDFDGVPLRKHGDR